MCEKWTQHPPEHSGACGGEEKPRFFSHELSIYFFFNNNVFVLTDPNLSQEARDKTTREMNFDSQRLTAFLRSASQVIFFLTVLDFPHEGLLWPKLTPVVFRDSIKVMVVLLEEDQAERKSLRKPKSQADTLSFSDGSLQLNTKLPFLYGTHFLP